MSKEDGRSNPDAELQSKFRLRSVPFDPSSALAGYHAHQWSDRGDLYKYSWPNGLKGELENIFRSTEFWEELKEDIEAAPDGYNLSLFLRYFDRDKDGKGVIDYGKRGKYTFLSVPYSFANRGGNFDAHIEYGFQPYFYSRTSEFAQLLTETRALIADKLQFPHEWDSTLRRENALKRESFWKELAGDIVNCEVDLGFKQFLQHYDPNEPQKTLPHHMDYSIADGKYRDFFKHLGNTTVTKRRREIPGELPSRQRWAKPFYEAAPPHIQMLLRSKFPADFGPITIAEMETVLGLPINLRPVLETVSMLRTDSQAEITNALGNYFEAIQQGEGMNLPTRSVDLMLRQAINQLRESMQEREPATISTLNRDAQTIFDLLNRVNDKEGTSPIPAKEALSTAFEQKYFTPLMKSILFKPTALFWHSYLLEHGAKSVPEDVFTSFLNELIQQESPNVQTQEEQQALLYLQTNIFPHIEQHFLADNAYALQMRFFGEHDRDGNPQTLFLHQVDEARTLVGLRGGISADETGSGKTVVVALTGLNLLDQMQNTERVRRMLVIGSKTVIDNWENEIGLHLDGNEIDVVNLTYSTKSRAAGRDFTLSQRLAMFEQALQSGEKPFQVAMVNYDVWRNPRFQAMLRQYSIDDVGIDETHNVKTSTFAALEELTTEEASKKGVAQRTAALYSFLTSHPEMPVFLATGTPFVKKLTEPLIMAHLVAPRKFPIERIEALKNDPVGVHRAVSEVMVRFRKSEIADLPAKHTQAVPINLEDMSGEEKDAFVARAANIATNWRGASARFYELLNLEGQAKFPWLIDTVREIVADGRKVDILTPFVQGKDRHTKDVSTAAIAQRLFDVGIPGVGILDGTLTDVQRLLVQESFRGEGGVRVLAGNYAVAGESITLSSSVNRATDVIVFVGPDSIARYIHGVDRIHRFGQPEEVTIHIPYVTGDLLGRSGGTYDERVVGRLQQELTAFEGVIDGRFFTEPKNIYQEIFRSPEARVPRKVYVGIGGNTVNIEDSPNGDIFREQFLNSLSQVHHERVATPRPQQRRTTSIIKTVTPEREAEVDMQQFFRQAPAETEVEEIVTTPEVKLPPPIHKPQSESALQPGQQVKNKAGEVGIVQGERVANGEEQIWIKFGKLDTYIRKDRWQTRYEIIPARK